MRQQHELNAFNPLTAMIRVLVVARSIVMRAGLEALITTEPTFLVVGSAANSETLIQQIEALQPDVVLLEWTSQEDELPAILLTSNDELSSSAKLPAIVLLIDDLQEATLPSETYRPIAELLRNGVRGILSSEATASEMVSAIAAAATGLTILHPDVMDALLLALPATARPLADSPTQALTAREVEVLGMLAEGLGNKTIARRLNISEHTVKFHISSIFSKLNASSRTEAVILGAKQGLVLL